MGPFPLFPACTRCHGTLSSVPYLHQVSWDPSHCFLPAPGVMGPFPLFPACIRCYGTLPIVPCLHQVLWDALLFPACTRCYGTPSCSLPAPGVMGRPSFCSLPAPGVMGPFPLFPACTRCYGTFPPVPCLHQVLWDAPPSVPCLHQVLWDSSPCSLPAPGVMGPFPLFPACTRCHGTLSPCSLPAPGVMGPFPLFPTCIRSHRTIPSVPCLHQVSIDKDRLPFNRCSSCVWVVCLFIYLFIHLFICLLIYLFIITLLYLNICILVLIYSYICLFTSFCSFLHSHGDVFLLCRRRSQDGDAGHLQERCCPSEVLLFTLSGVGPDRIASCRTSRSW